MTKERLSKLQKWILIECYNQKDQKMRRGKIFSGFYGWKPRYKDGTGFTPNNYFNSIDKKEYNKAQVTVTRSLRTLLKNRYIDCSGEYDCGLIYIYDKELAKGIGCEVSETKSEELKTEFKEFQEAHNITWEEWSKKYKFFGLPVRAEEKFSNYRDAHPDVAFDEWYKKTQPPGYNYLGEKKYGNIKWIHLTEKGINKTKEMLNVNSKNHEMELTLKTHVHGMVR